MDFRAAAMSWQATKCVSHYARGNSDIDQGCAPCVAVFQVTSTLSFLFFYIPKLVATNVGSASRLSCATTLSLVA
jgi:hypothetical protein